MHSFKLILKSNDINVRAKDFALVFVSCCIVDKGSMTALTEEVIGMPEVTHCLQTALNGRTNTLNQ